MDNEAYFHSEIHRILKLGPDLSKPMDIPQKPVEPEATGLPFDLPIAQENLQPRPSQPESNSAAVVLPTYKSGSIVPQFQVPQIQSVDELKFDVAPPELRLKQEYKPAVAKAASSQTKKGWISYLVYPAVFFGAFVVFYSVLNFGALSAQVSSWFTKPQEEVELADDLPEYTKWISGYFFSVGDKDKLQPNNDIDADGLTNIEEFRIKTNPTLADSDSDGTNDGVEIINGTNPWGKGETSRKQDLLLEKTDLIQINNRISFNAAASSGTLQAIKHSDNFNLGQNGRLTIPRLKIQVPLVWTEDPATFDDDLTKGVVHYPGTALPGEKGVVYISGHSSDYFWKKHAYRQIFAKINALETGDDIFVDVYGKDGKVYNYRYRVTTETVYAPDDQRQFIDQSGYKLNLSTCWPIGTQKDRYVVTAELVK